MTAHNLSADKSRLSYVQGLRAIAVLLVVLYHAGVPISGGFIGVDVFFVISGFVIARMLLREQSSSGRIQLSQFYKRRILRLYPAFGVLVVVVLIASAPLLSPLGTQETAAKSGFAAILSMANLVIPFISGGYFQLGSEDNPFLHTWSLSVEEQFYLVFPALIVFGVWLRKKRSWRLRPDLSLVILLGVISFAFCLAFSFAGTAGTTASIKMESFSFYSPLTRAWEFAIGAVLAFSWSHLESLSKRALNVLGIGGAICLILTSLSLDSATTFPGIAAMAPVLSTAAMIVSGAQPGHLIPNALSSPMLTWIGDRSYSWYLWHWPFIVLATSLIPGEFWVAPTSAALSLLPAMLSYRYVESTYRNHRVDLAEKPRLSQRALVVGTTCVVAVGTLAVVLVVGVGSQWASPKASSMRAQIVPAHTDTAIGCSNSRPLSERVDTQCLSRNSGTGPTFYLFGDSLAGQYSEPVAIAAKNLGSNVLFGTMPACPTIDLEIRTEGAPLTECRQFVRSSLKWLATQKPGIIIMSLRSDAYLNGDRFTVSGHSGNRPVESLQKEEAYASGLARTFQTLEEAGHSVIFVQPALRFVYPNDVHWSARTCSFARIAIDASSCGLSVLKSDLRADREKAIQAFSMIPSKYRPTSVDFFDRLCPSTRCSTNDGTYWLHKDASHLSVQASARLAPYFQNYMNRSADRLGTD